MTAYHLQYPQKGLRKARALRRTMTDAERKLWARLRGNALGVHFRRQVPQGPYVCDFLCVKAGLVVEVDGSQHMTSEGKEHDRVRSKYLATLGYSVIRFTNREVLLNLEGVLQRIYDYVHIINPPHLRPPRRGEEA